MRTASTAQRREVLLAVPLFGLLALIAIGCGKPEQMATVERLNERSQLVRLSCLDANGDGRINAGDSAPEDMPDVTGDTTVNEDDLAVVAAVDIDLATTGREACDESNASDWEITESSALDCSTSEQAVLVLAVGGGAVDLSDLESAAGARWMLVRIGEALEKRGVAHRLVSAAPGVAGAVNPHAATEAWTAAYLSDQLNRHPCLHLIMLGHSHGGVTVTAVASRLEAAGFADRVTFTALIDRATGLYTGDTVSLPTQSPVVNFYLPAADGPHGALIDLPNVTNIDGSTFRAPADGEEGGDLVPVRHSTIDNAPDVLEQLLALLEEKFAAAQSDA